MILTCPSCSIRYLVNDRALGAQGRVVRCARCGHSWFEEPPAAADLAAAPARPIEPEAADDAVFPPEIDDAPPPVRGPQRVRPMPPGSNLPALPGAVGRGRGWIGWVALVVVLIGGFVGGIGWRDQIVAYWPPALQLYALAELPVVIAPRLAFEFRNIGHDQAVEEGQKVFKITGEVVNVGTAAQRVPRLRVAISDENGKELSHWTVIMPPRKLTPGDVAPFTARLPNPPANLRNYSIGFYDEG